MNQVFYERSYPGEIARPSVEMIKGPGGKFLMAATSWGNKEVLKEISQSFSESLTAGMTDREATSPFIHLPTLSPLANGLRGATILANEKAYKNCNSNAYSSACEALVLAFDGPEMAWVQIGQPHLLLVRGGHLVPLEVGIDLGMDYGMPAPLPSRLLGINPDLDVVVKSAVIKPDDKMIMLARSTIPSDFFTQDLSQGSQEILAKLFEVAVNEDGRQPFWISVID